MNMLADYVKILLWACIEDYAGIWELLWEINSKFPELPRSERRRVTFEVIQLLLHNNFVKLYRCKEPYGDLSELDTDAAHLALKEDKNWEPPAIDGVSIRAEATEKGKDLYQSGDYDSLF